MANLDGMVQMLKKEHVRVTKEMKAIAAALSAFGTAYGKGGSTSGRDVCCWKSQNRGCPKSTMGESEGQRRNGKAPPSA